MKSNDLNVKQINEQLARISGMKVQDNLYETTGGDNGSLKGSANDLQVEDTNALVSQIAGGFLSEDLGASRTTLSEQSSLSEEKVNLSKDKEARALDKADFEFHKAWQAYKKKHGKDEYLAPHIKSFDKLLKKVDVHMNSLV